MRRTAILLLGVALAACSPASGSRAPDGGPDGAPEGGHHCTYGFVGDPSMPPEIQMVALGPGMTNVPVMDGDMVTLAFPPQGGRVIFAGVRARNLDACAVQIEGSVRDLMTKQIRLDSRTVNLIPGPDGWAASDPTDISTFANIPVCPNEWSATNLYGTTYELDFSLTDRSGHMAAQTLHVVPACAEPAHAVDCLCICKGGYVLGESCADAGAGDGGASDGGDGGV
jgi:hypothetical protein